jgi:transcription antitermination factor NusA-like protein
MRAPICELCAATGELCSGCRGRLERGEITQLDVKVGELLHRHRKRLSLEGVVVPRALDLGRLVVLMTESEPGLLVGPHGRVAKEFARELGRHVRVIPAGLEFKRFAEELLLPVKPLGVNRVFRPGGEEHRVRIPKRELPRLPTDLESLKRGLAYASDKPVSLALE